MHDQSWNMIDVSLDRVLIDPSNLLVYKISCGPYIYNLNPRNNHRYLLGKEILIEAILLSRCQIVLCGDSNVSEFSKLVSNKELVKFYQINNGYNSDNKIISKILWYIKLILPKSLGGFDNNFFKQITK